MTVTVASEVAAQPTATPSSAPVWTKRQIVSAFEHASVAALGGFVGALTVTDTSNKGLVKSAIAAGIAAGVAFVSTLRATLV